MCVNHDDTYHNRYTGQQQANDLSAVQSCKRGSRLSSCATGFSSRTVAYAAADGNDE